MNDVADRIGLDALEATAALRDGNVERLLVAFGRWVDVEARRPGWDARDTMISLTPFIDCARRFGGEPAATLGPIAATGPAWFRDTFESFARRTDITLVGFGWALVETPEGLAYRFGLA